MHNNDCKIVDDNVNYESNDDTNNDVNVDDFDHDDYDDEEKTGVEDLGVKFGNDRTVDNNPYVNKKRNNCKGNLKDDSTYGNSVVNSNTNRKIKICEDSIEKEVTMFDNIGDIKSHIKNATKAETSQVYVTGPIHNDRTGKTHLVVVFGDSGLV